MPLLSQFQTATCQKISGDVGDEIVIQPDILVTANPNPFNIPTVNWDDILVYSLDTMLPTNISWYSEEYPNNSTACPADTRPQFPRKSFYIWFLSEYLNIPAKSPHNSSISPANTWSRFLGKWTEYKLQTSKVNSRRIFQRFLHFNCQRWIQSFGWVPTWIGNSTRSLSRSNYSKIGWKMQFWFSSIIISQFTADP